MKHLLVAIALFSACALETDPDLSATEQAGTIPACTSGTWCAETAPVGTPRLRGVHAVSANDVFAVGDTGTIIERLSGNDWATMTSGTTSTLYAVWGSSSTDVWATGAAGLVLHYDGTSWSTVTTSFSPAVALNAVWQDSSGGIWTAGSRYVWRSTDGGANWTRYAFSAVGTFLSLSGTSSSDVWVTGGTSYVDHYDGLAWTRLTGAGLDCMAVLAVATNNVHAAVATGTKKWNGSSWSTISASATFNDLHMQTTTDLWAVGGTKVGRYSSGTSWTLTTPFGASVALYGVTGVPSTDVWAVGITGTDGLIEHYAY